MLEGYNKRDGDVVVSKHNDDQHPTSSSNTGDYVNKVAHSLTQSMNEHASELQEECAICLENPSLTEAVCTPCEGCKYLQKMKKMK